MFSSKNGESRGASLHKTLLRAAARTEWPSIGPSELAPVKTENELVAVVSAKTGRTLAEATVEVRRWMQRQNMRPDIGTGFLARRPVSRWENEGGALGTFIDKSAT
ncbi:hypothetical protein [Devosia sp. XK-2]|uniref:hypothetical protein n=1 Tax=Devosia sp. XK-2 TaxID=3126689 RepID=UPI0030CB5F92